MKPQPASLEQLERWMQSVITHPHGVEGGVESPQAREHLNVSLAELESVITRSRALESRARLEIYVDAYFERLLECLREEFAVTRRAVGEGLFDALAFGYLQSHPSRSYTLGALGEKFAGFLAESRLHAGEAPAGAPPSWDEFVVELARFERVQREVFDGPGTERLNFDFEMLRELPSARWSELRLIAAPSLRLERYSHPVHVFWARCKAGDDARAPAANVTHLAIHRRDYAIVRHELSSAQFELLSRLVDGKNLAEAIQQSAPGESAARQAFESDLPQWFARWTANGYFLAPGVPQS